MTIVGYVLLAVGLVAAFGNMTGGGFYRPQGANARLVFALAIAAMGGYLAFGR